MNNNAFRNLSYGVYIISTWDNGRATGCTANSAMQITSDPATIAISINHNNYTNKCIEESGNFAISILGENSDPSIIGTFGFQSGKDINKFDSVNYEIKGNMPIVMEGCAYLTCKVINKMETDTHTVFLGKVLDADILSEDSPMTYSYYHKVIKGKSPKNAPTYIAENTPVEKKSEKYVCSVCGYVYEGDNPFEELPDEYTCPICKQPKKAFKKQ
ncbi:flavin reductase [Clostridium saccharobutylicum]|uniref:High molecular weight rubredoxin Hrb n=1 Tax=Clostridium saccharobutylicum DSM 13864 TaxID=1345695 RepID=U5MS25_CLOSA|nr:flavin reductase [Clostridium saccharobutylicum]AGX43380.1 high molecular weight rubredoxin Hrb [Clostridium saccharobutylicum DSM 13864]AQR90677.1 high molecular weight rubredoxin [Clostridium saccharobutylicum]AQS00581.1 high molecular weight rubredoxin [Clostridium saccharobutylicum]AQS14564.1 high molecular weight rubredoxin [Clostridium saccharobutylicum]MBA2907509.1 flavin reductase (DIM6/NTAB) family NADH-FMN oxidoreductase RutF/rubredoxin [Clostridium saccharobutylicum]